MRLSNGLEIPSIGLGTYPMKGKTLHDTIGYAYKEGYRLIDTADNYYNEEYIGDCLKTLIINKGAKREEFFIVSKVSDDLYPSHELGGGANKGRYFWKSSPYMAGSNSVHAIVNQRFEDSLRNLQTDYIDLYMMHWPYPDYLNEIWYELELLYKSGKVRSIGVCNFRERHFEKLCNSCSIFPMVNQFETSPLNTKETLVDYCKQQHIQVMVYSPLMSLRYRDNRIYQDYLRELACKYKCDVAQICLRFNIQRGLIPIPKSSNLERLRKNMSALSFQLSKDEMARLLAFNENIQYLPESRACPGF